MSVRYTPRSIDKISHFLTDTCPLYNPAGTCKCRICKQVFFIDLDKEYTTVAKMIRLADLYQKFEKDLPPEELLGKIFGLSCHNLYTVTH